MSNRQTLVQKNRKQKTEQYESHQKRGMISVAAKWLADPCFTCGTRPVVHLRTYPVTSLIR